jgi:hypothetical protein
MLYDPYAHRAVDINVLAAECRYAISALSTSVSVVDSLTLSGTSLCERLQSCPPGAST